MPVFDVTTDKVAVDVNQSAVLVCRAHAVPPPRFDWYYGLGQAGRTTRLSPSGRLRATVSSRPGQQFVEATLAIDRVMASDLGRYICSASNDMGEASHSIELSVKSKWK